MCDYCEAMTINNVYCHEQGCPEAWRDEIKECLCCGSEFKPDEKGQLFCDESCAENYF
jgi:hypothetical protein